MTLHSFTVNNYRSFAQKTKLALKPLTLVFGRNSAGKSALLRALPLLATSFKMGRTVNPLALESDAARGAAFDDLICRAGSQRLWLELGLSFVDGDSKEVLETEIRFREDDPTRHFVQQFTMANRGKLSLEAFCDGEDYLNFDVGLSSQPGTPILRGQIHPMSQKFKADQFSASSQIAPLRDRIAALTNQFQQQCLWLGSLRTVPQRKAKFPVAQPEVFDPSGENLLQLLAWDSRYNQSKLTDLVAGWYRKHFNLTLRVDADAGEFRLRLGPYGTSYDVDICDTGEGMAQCLPVITAIHWAEQSAIVNANVLLAIEQPELHLHLDAQHALADLLCEVAMRPAPPTLLIETHSEGMLVAIQLAVASGNLDPAKVQVHIVRAQSDGSSVVESVTFDQLGAPVGVWPHDMFRQIIDDARKLAEIRRTKRAT